MRVAITTTGTTLDSEVNPRFGRAEYILVHDTDTGKTQAIANQINMGAAQGAGVQTAKRIAEAGAEAVIASHVGPRAYRALASQGIKVYLAEGLAASEALERLQQGELAESSSADVEGHW